MDASSPAPAAPDHPVPVDGARPVPAAVTGARVLATVDAGAGFLLIPFTFFGLAGLAEGGLARFGVPAVAAGYVLAPVAAVALPVLQLRGAERLRRRRGRWLLVAACLPWTVLAVVAVAGPLLGTNAAPLALQVLLLPLGLAPLLALAPSVGGWLAQAREPAPPSGTTR